MDSLTHLLLGAAVGEAVLGKKAGKKAMLWGAVADTIPDFDVFFVPLFDPAVGLMVHRGITHSLFFVVLVSPLFGWTFSKIYRKANGSWKDWTKLFFAGILTHILLDAFTTYGTGLFEPFSSMRVSFSSIFIADPFYTFPLLVAVIALLFLKRNSARRKFWTRLGLGVSTAYLLFTGINKLYTNAVFEHALQKQQKKYSRYMSAPTPLNNFLWMVVAEDRQGYWTGYYSLFDKTKDIPFTFIPRNEVLIEDVKNEPTVKVLQQFSDHYFVINQHNENLYFNDLRFGKAGGWNDDDSPYVFRFELKKKPDGSLEPKQAEWESNGKSIGQTFGELIDRIKGT